VLPSSAPCRGGRAFLDDRIKCVGVSLHRTDDLAKVRATLDAKRRATDLAADGEDLVTRTVDAFRTMASVLGDKTFSLERRREVLRRLLPKHGDVRPIQVHIDPDAPRGWRKALKRVEVESAGSRGSAGVGRVRRRRRDSDAAQ
jgi:hypothetical protein